LIGIPRPKVHKNAEDQIHCSNGPAVEWGDDEWYFHNGVEVPEEYVVDPESIDPLTIFTEQNVERRRALIDIIGWGKVLAKLPSHKLHKDERGELWETDEPPGDDGTHKARFVRVRCPSTDRLFVHRVDPSVETAAAAVASMWGKTPETYNPVKET
jgi:hypothetical protein